MSSQPGIPHEQYSGPMPYVPSQKPKERAISIFNPGPEGVHSSSQSNQSSTGAASDNDKASDGAPGQTQNAGGKVCNIKHAGLDRKG